MGTIHFVVPGVPVAKGRPRFTHSGRTYTPRSTEVAQELVRDAWIRAGALELSGPLGMYLIFSTERPKAHYRRSGELTPLGERTPYPVRKPDIDNLVKLVLDALNGVAYRDDNQVCHLTAHRMWAIGSPLTIVDVQEIA